MRKRLKPKPRRRFAKFRLPESLFLTSTHTNTRTCSPLCYVPCCEQHRPAGSERYAIPSDLGGRCNHAIFLPVRAFGHVTLKCESCVASRVDFEKRWMGEALSPRMARWV